MVILPFVGPKPKHIEGRRVAPEGTVSAKRCDPLTDRHVFYKGRLPILTIPIWGPRLLAQWRFAVEFMLDPVRLLAVRTAVLGILGK